MIDVLTNSAWQIDDGLNVRVMVTRLRKASWNPQTANDAHVWDSPPTGRYRARMVTIKIQTGWLATTIYEHIHRKKIWAMFQIVSCCFGAVTA